MLTSHFVLTAVKGLKHKGCCQVAHLLRTSCSTSSSCEWIFGLSSIYLLVRVGDWWNSIQENVNGFLVIWLNACTKNQGSSSSSSRFPGRNDSSGDSYHFHFVSRCGSMYSSSNCFLRTLSVHIIIPYKRAQISTSKPGNEQGVSSLESYPWSIKSFKALNWWPVLASRK